MRTPSRERLRVPLTVVVPTLDEEPSLPACLAGLAFADQVIVVDSGSRDRTVECARDLGAEVLVRPFTTYGAQRNHGAAHARHDWVLCVDADERVSEALAEEIADVVAAPERPGYRVPRQAWVAGRPIRHCGWDRDRVLRLYDRRRGSWDLRAVHERVVLDGAPGDLTQTLHHHTYRDLPHFVDKTRRYALLGADELHRAGARGGLSSLLVFPAWRFLRMYLVDRGFLDGVPGLIVCGLGSYGVFLKYARLWEIGRDEPQPSAAAVPPGETAVPPPAAGKVRG